jgi:hypothetical protein
LLLGKLKKEISYFESVAAGRTNRLKLTAQGTSGMTAILKKMSMMMMVVVVCFCVMSPASAVLAYDSSYSSSVEKVNFSGREGLVWVPCL